MMINDKYMDLVADKHKQAYLDYKNGRTLEAYGSHQPLLIHVLNSVSNGSVLEFGSGWNSTPLMHTICEQQNRKLLTLETDKDWAERFNDLRTPNHIFATPDLHISDSHFAVALVDGEPWQLRQGFVSSLSTHCDYVIVHDTQEIVYGVDYIKQRSDCVYYGYDFSMYKHIYHFGSLPKTSLLSNLETINKDIDDFFKL